MPDDTYVENEEIEFPPDPNEGDLTILGNIGIGTTNPTSKLQVIGDVSINGNLNVGIITATNGIITNLIGTSGTITTLNSTNGIITTLNSTNGIITNLIGTAGTITTLNSTNGIITNLIGTAGTITTLNSTNLIVSGIATVGLGTTSNPLNSQMSFELTNDTTLTIRVRGTDGIVRTGIVTIS